MEVGVAACVVGCVWVPTLSCVVCPNTNQLTLTVTSLVTLHMVTLHLKWLGF